MLLVLFELIRVTKSPLILTKHLCDVMAKKMLLLMIVPHFKNLVSFQTGRSNQTPGGAV